MVIKDENDVLLFKKTVAAPKPPVMAGAPMRIGRSWFDGNDNYYVGPYRGRIDNVKVYNYPAAGITTGVDGRTGSAAGVCSRAELSESVQPDDTDQLHGAGSGPDTAHRV